MTFPAVWEKLSKLMTSESTKDFVLSKPFFFIRMAGVGNQPTGGTVPPAPTLSASGPPATDSFGPPPTPIFEVPPDTDTFLERSDGQFSEAAGEKILTRRHHRFRVCVVTPEHDEPPGLPCPGCPGHPDCRALCPLVLLGPGRAYSSSLVLLRVGPRAQLALRQGPVASSTGAEFQDAP